ncbi:MarR family winged helix-turn-helix transcriptional regulator [Roseomonas marmotae]|uniref:Winged helix-turn-helix transcriptional regulator n=1 Tax=Roseomonas marmotae TaxID=2768161 RepID=A0ABS3K9T6_9PROT|nr:MarR family winged helix-turn-helix transcriptional regulator [Roseomonas marmotae]MBO1074229.1 winged helix-turn-helix transcriptional regulator [Roseomonas marmotae]QTI78994.1 winged helix-turn-helix transcriptional regulator [Roseomonas marmotae]
MISEVVRPGQRRPLGALLRRPYDVLQHRVYGRIGERGFPEIRVAHSSVLRNLPFEGSRVSELAERARMAKQSMSYLVEDLAASGYVNIAPHPHDRRAKLVTLTERGLEMRATLVALSDEVEADLARAIGQAEMKRLRALLEKLYDVAV